MHIRMLATAAVATLTGLAMAGAAHAEEMPTRPYAVIEADGCEVTVHVTSPDEWRDGSARTWPVMLVVDDGDQVDVLTVEPGATGAAGPYDLATTGDVAYRIFGTAERDDDAPAWDADQDTITAHIAEHGDTWVTGGIADVPAWVGWHTATVDGCEPVDDPAPTPAPTGEPTTEPTSEPTTEPTSEPTDDPGAGAGGSDDDTLPVTSGLVVPVVLGGVGLAAVAVGGVALAVGRRRGLPLD